MKNSTFARARVGALLFAGVMGFAAQAHAIDFNVTPDFTPQLSAVPDGTGLVYKADDFGMDPVQEEGSAWNYYTTVFTGDVSDPSGATITWDGGANYIACPSCYLVVKDGNHDPYQYIFDISSWNGQDTLVLSGFWPDQGAISNVAIMVPEADTYAMLLAGLGLVGFVARRRLSKTA